MTKLRGVMWWMDRWRNSTAFTDMTLEEQGAYRNLCDEVWLRPDGVIPEASLPRACGDAVAWPKVRDRVLRWMQEVEGGWTNDTAREVMLESQRLSDVRASAGRAGGQAKRKQRGKQNESKPPSKPASKTEASGAGAGAGAEEGEGADTPPTPPQGGGSNEETSLSLLRREYAERYERDTSSPWMSSGANHRQMAEVARWVDAMAAKGKDPATVVARLLDGFWLDEWAKEHRWPWKRLAKDPGAFYAPPPAASGRAAPTVAETLAPAMDYSNIHAAVEDD